MKIRQFSAGAVVVRGTGSARRYLLLRAFKFWDFPKGLVEQAEDPLRAARREVEEETGLSQLDFPWGHEFFETGPYRRSKVARYYVALASQAEEEVYLPVNPELGRPEHHEFRWVSYNQGLHLLNDRLRPVLQWAHQITASAIG